jgi:general secretion pathway protein K
LILALVVVTVVVLLASTINSDFVVTFKRVENQLLGQQASAYMRGAEGIARKILLDDYNANTGKDHRSEGWLNKSVEFPMDQGVIVGTLCDLQGRFNVNKVVGKPGKYTADQEIFIRLLQVLELDDPLDQQTAEDLSHALSDWIDNDSDINSTGGAEEGYYSSLDLPMRTANQPLQSVSELRWVKGMTAEIYQALAPYVVALPDTVPLNINTAEMPVIRAINEATVLQPLSESEADAIISDRDGDIELNGSQLSGGFDSLTDFVAAHPASTLVSSNLSVSSDYFLLNTDTYFKDRQFKLSSVLHRDSSGNIKTIARGKAGFGVCAADNSE